MGLVYFAGDLHLRSGYILKHRSIAGVSTMEEHDEYIIDKFNSVLRKRDTIFLMGDVCDHIDGLPLLKRIRGNKILIRGNHDQCHISEYLKYFSEVQGFRTYKGYFISHAPIHPDELRGRRNIHAHCHDKPIRLENGELDDRYICTSLEQISFTPILFSDIKDASGGPQIEV